MIVHKQYISRHVNIGKIKGDGNNKEINDT